MMFDVLVVLSVQKEGRTNQFNYSVKQRRNRKKEAWSEVLTSIQRQHLWRSGLRGEKKLYNEANYNTNTIIKLHY